MARKSAKQIAKDTIYIICGGETEKLYFEKFRKTFHKELAGIKLVVREKGKDPVKLVEEAINNYLGEKSCLEVWVVFDKDDFTNFDEAIMIAKNNNIKCAFSNQAFEVWFLSYRLSVQGPLHRNRYKSEIKKRFDFEYDKKTSTVESFVKKLMDKDEIKVATNNAKIAHSKHLIEKTSQPPSTYESCTTVYQLVNRLLQ